MSYSQYKNIGVDPEEKNNSFEVHDIQNLEERLAAIKKYPVVIIDNYTSWCGPCKIVSPKFAKLAQLYEEKGVLFLKEDVDKNFGDCPTIMGVPCFHFYVGGVFLEEYTVVGADVNAVEKNLNKILNSATNK
jgi:thioredoxin 1